MIGAHTVAQVRDAEEPLLASMPEGYRHLAYIQTRIGYKVKMDMPMLKGPVVQELYRRGERWLAGGARFDVTDPATAESLKAWYGLLCKRPTFHDGYLQTFNLPNVHLVGAQPYATLPAWAKAFDAAIIPYRLNRQVANANPLKLREYLATGKPVVSVGNAEIEKFARWVRIADDHAGFLAALDVAIHDQSAEATAARIAAVADQTWDRRVEDVLEAVAQAMTMRQQNSLLSYPVTHGN